MSDFTVRELIDELLDRQMDARVDVIVYIDGEPLNGDFTIEDVGRSRGGHSPYIEITVAQ